MSFFLVLRINCGYFVFLRFTISKFPLEICGAGSAFANRFCLVFLMVFGSSVCIEPAGQQIHTIYICMYVHKPIPNAVCNVCSVGYIQTTQTQQLFWACERHVGTGPVWCGCKQLPNVCSPHVWECKSDGQANSMNCFFCCFLFY